MNSSLWRVHQGLSKKLKDIDFSYPVAYSYNPLDYASETLRMYIDRYCQIRGAILLLGMNPGPFGMAQTGIPFGDPVMVKDWLKIRGTINKPSREHPKRPVLGFSSARREISGKRLWGWARNRFGSPDCFFSRFQVLNYCPLLFLEKSGRNLTPDKISKPEREILINECDRALCKMIDILEPSLVVGIGAFAEKRAKAALGNRRDLPVTRLLHPSPASPAANTGWEKAADELLSKLPADNCF